MHWSFSQINFHMPKLFTHPEEFLAILRQERKDVLDRLRKTKFSSLKPEFTHSQIIPYASYSPWADDLDFSALYECVQPNTMVDLYRCYELYSLAQQCAHIPGDLVEVGVWRGGTAALLAAGAQKHISLFDTFTGVVKSDTRYDTLYTGNEHADTHQEIVESLFKILKIECSIYSGIFPDQNLDKLPEKISLAHIDVDTRGSASEAFDVIWPKIQPGGIVIFDDYGFFGCEGITELVNSIAKNLRDAFFVHNLNGHGLLIKQFIHTAHNESQHTRPLSNS